MTNLLKKYFSKQNSDLNKWVKRFGFGNWVEIKYLYGNSYSIRFKEKRNSKIYTSIANSGFGASQILPLIVQALVSPEGSMTIAEQPEIHLNPKLQCELADLFAFMAKRDQKIIIETHSEYLLLRLRKLIADKTISSDDIAIYFIEKKEGYSDIREIKVEPDGHIDSEQWPDDFFEDSLREALSLATHQFNK
jgi:predicted ATPase